VCQNETIAASHAELAQDLRKQIRIKLQQGQSPNEIMDFMVARYGDFVRYRPALKGTTLLLWIGPFVLLLTALAGLAYVIQQRRNTPQTPLSDDQRARAKTLLTPPHPPTSI
jgi:cytochrome c-type biogenesis protein CcmH